MPNIHVPLPWWATTGEDRGEVRPSGDDWTDMRELVLGDFEVGGGSNDGHLSGSVAVERVAPSRTLRQPGGDVVYCNLCMREWASAQAHRHSCVREWASSMLTHL